MTEFTKIMKKYELDFTIIAEENELSPKLISIDKIEEDKYKVTMKRYKQSLINIQLKDRHKYLEQIETLVTKLHALGIYHGDISEDNIVLNNDIDIKLIDFGGSRYIEKITDIYTAYTGKSKNINELLMLELEECRFICKCR